MADPNPTRTAKLAGSMKKAFGEFFDIVPMIAQGDVNARKVADIGRQPMLGIAGMWDGPMNSQTPATRGAITDDVAHAWKATFPSVTFFEADLPWMPQRDDKIVRKLTNETYRVVNPLPDGLGTVNVTLSNRDH